MTRSRAPLALAIVIALALPALAGCVGDGPVAAEPPGGGGDGGNGNGNGNGGGTPPASPHDEPRPAHSCGVAPPVPELPTAPRFDASFEQGGGGFVADCALPVPGPGGALAAWDVARSGDAAASGEWGLRLALPEDGRDGVVWVERAVRLPDTRARHDVELSFAMRAVGGTPVEAVAFVGMLSPYRLEQFTPEANGTTSIPGAAHLRETLPANGSWTTLTLTGQALTSSQGVLFVAVGFARAGDGPAAVDLDDVAFEAVLKTW